MNIPELDDVRVQRDIIVQSFSFGDLDPKYEGLSEATGNIFCPFHDNYDTPAAKAYHDKEQDIVVIHCFSEKKRYTSYDYVNIILCDRKRRYSSPRAFLEDKFSEERLRELAVLAKQKLDILDETMFEKKVEYIENVYNKYDNVEEFIDSLYNEYD